MKRWQTYNEAFARPDKPDLRFSDIIQNQELKSLAQAADDNIVADENRIAQGLKEIRFAPKKLILPAVGAALGSAFAISIGHPEGIPIAIAAQLGARELGLQMGLAIDKHEKMPHLAHADEIRETIYEADKTLQEGRPVDFMDIVRKIEKLGDVEISFCNNP